METKDTSCLSSLSNANDRISIITINNSSEEENSSQKDETKEKTNDSTSAKPSFIKKDDFDNFVSTYLRSSLASSLEEKRKSRRENNEGKCIGCTIF